MSSTFSYNAAELKANTKNATERVRTVVEKTTDYHGLRGENAMRKGAKWTDRTTNARNGLNVRVEHSRDTHTLTFAHGVAYGIWLETRFAGKYAIIMPTVLSEGKAMMTSFRKIFKGA